MTILRSSMFPSSSASRRTTSIVTAQNVAGFTVVGLSGVYSFSAVISTLSGALTANTLKTMLDITGSGGIMPILAIRNTDTTSRTLRVVVTVDGASVFDRTSAAFTTATHGAILAGSHHASVPISIPPIRWTTSLKIEIASSLTETDKLETFWNYNLES